VFDEFHQLVTAILRDEHQLPIEIYGVTDLDRHRARITRSANRVFRRIWGLRDWTFKYVEDGVVTIPAGTHEGNLPAGWVNEGRQGGVWTREEPRREVTWKRAGLLRNMVNTNPNEEGLPLHYSVIAGAVGAHRLLVFPKDSVDRELLVSYEKATPLLVDDPGGPSIGEIDALPYQWRHVLYEWTVAREMKAKGDLSSYGEQMREVGESLFDMVCGEHQGKPSQEWMPSYAGAPMESDWMDI
jgi:hypothetical protein